MLYLNFTDFPILTTSRLLLRQLTNEDFAQLHKLQSDSAANALLGRIAPIYISETKAYIKKINDLTLSNQCIYWDISLRANKNLNGTICFWNFDIKNELIEIGFELLPEFQGRGFMIEAVNRTIEYCFDEMEAKAILAYPPINNVASIALLEKANFKHIKNAYSPSNGDVDKLKYVLKRIDYTV